MWEVSFELERLGAGGRAVRMRLHYITDQVCIAEAVDIALSSVVAPWLLE